MTARGICPSQNVSSSRTFGRTSGHSPPLLITDIIEGGWTAGWLLPTEYRDRNLQFSAKGAQEYLLRSVSEPTIHTVLKAEEACCA